MRGTVPQGSVRARTGLPIRASGPRRAACARTLGRGTLAALAFALLCVAAPPAATLEWQSFTPDEGGFRLDLPAPPLVEQIRKGRAMFRFESTAYRADVGADGFGVNHTDLPRAIALLVPRGRILEATRRGLIDEASATEVSFRKIRFAGRDARELVYDRPAQDDKPPLRGTARMFFEGPRLYVFWVEAPPALPATVREQFFASVHVDAH